MAFSAFSLNKIAAVELKDDAVVSDFNGSLGNVDLSSPMSFVDEKYKIVLSENNQIHLDHTIAYMLWVAQGKNVGAAIRAVNQTDVDTIMPIVAVRVAAYSTLAICRAANIVLNYRSADTISNIKFAALNLPDGIMETSRRIIAFIREDVQALSEIGANALFVPLALVANKKHRDDEKGHNWYTKEADVQGTSSNRLIPMAGKKKEDFAVFMRIHGHDLWHFLTDATMETIAGNLTVPFAESQMITHDLQYKGANVNGERIGTVIDVGSACRDRYNSGTIGLSSIILGIGYLLNFTNQVSLKVPHIDASGLTTDIDRLRAALSANDITRQQILDARTSLHYSIAFAVGFGMAYTEIENDLRNHQSLVRFADSNLAGKVTGNAIGRAMKELNTDADALKESIGQMIMMMANSVRRAVDSMEGNEAEEVD